jgi:hypothetical protein
MYSGMLRALQNKPQNTAERVGRTLTEACGVYLVYAVLISLPNKGMRAYVACEMLSSHTHVRTAVVYKMLISFHHG